jgi:hypothetical protein
MMRTRAAGITVTVHSIDTLRRLSQVAGTIADLSTEAGRNAYLRGITAKRFAAAASEVLIQGNVPPTAISPVGQ